MGEVVKSRRLIVITDCVRECPYITTKATEGAGCATDYACSKVSKKKPKHITGYIEWASELPKHGTFPKWCPLQEAEPGMYLEAKTSR